MSSHRFRVFPVVDTADGQLVAGSAVVVDGVRCPIRTRVVMGGCGWQSRRPINRLAAALAAAGWRPYWGDELLLNRERDGSLTVSALEIRPVEDNQN